MQAPAPTPCAFGGTINYKHIHRLSFIVYRSLRPKQLPFHPYQKAILTPISMVLAFGYAP